MKKYKHKPTIIEAIQWDGEKLEGRYPIEFFRDKSASPEWFYIVEWRYGRMLDGGLRQLIMEIGDTEEEAVVNPGDYVVKGIIGEYYPVKQELFKELYEEEEKNNES